VFDIARLRDTGLVAAIDHHERLGSTSDRALEQAARGETPLPLLVLAERQTAGRGRGTNRWWSDEGALTFSLVLAAPPEQLPPSRWPQVALVAGLAVSEALQTLAPAADLRVKWPNDVFLDGRKVAGILSESVPGWRDRLVVGVGVNVNNGGQEPGVRSRESDAGSQAVALVEHDGVMRDLTTSLLAVLDQFDLRWRQLIENGFGPIAATYREHCLLTGCTVAISQPGGQRVAGCVRGIDDDGMLILATEAGPTRIVAGSVVAWEATS
jgi:BirA family biotin operon repressor/biotin-[acetyl-CoA-carboxylase] ligase